MANLSSSKITIVKSSTRPKEKPDRLPWPRSASDNPAVHLGVDVVAKRQDIIKLVHKFFYVDTVPMEELLQEVYLAILHKNHTRSAHDPRKSSFGHYVYMIANNVCINLVHKKRRYDREKDSIYEKLDDEDLAPIETAAVDTSDSDYESPVSEAVEAYCRKNHMYELARYIRASRFGATTPALRAALSFGSVQISAKDIKRMRETVIEITEEVQASTYL